MARSECRPLTRAQTLAVLGVVFEERRGFCMALGRLQDAGLITDRKRQRLLNELRRIAWTPHYYFWWPADRPVGKDAPRLAAVRQLQRKGRGTRDE